MKKTFTLLTIFSFLFAFSLAQGGGNVLYTNGSFVNNPGGHSTGADASMVMTSLGYSTNGSTINLSKYQKADDFTIEDAEWQIDTIYIYGYQTNGGIPSTLTAGYIEIWNGRPDSATSSVVWGNMTTNLMGSTGWTNCYRVKDTDLTSTSRAIHYVACPVNFKLTKGKYWIRFAVKGSTTSGPYCPPVPPQNEKGTPNAYSYKVSNGVWSPSTDKSTGNPVDYPFVIIGSKVLSAVEELSGMPEDFKLSQNYPNPFNPTTTIEFSIAKEGMVNISVFNVLGQKVAELINDVKSVGNYKVNFNASNLTSGVYYYRLTAGNYTITKKMQLIK